MKKIFNGVLFSLAFLLFASTAYAAVNSVTPSTNDINRSNGWAHVDQVSVDVGEVTLNFIQPRSFAACFEYRTDGDTDQRLMSGGVYRDNYNAQVTDGLYPFFCLNNNNSIRTIRAKRYVEVRMVFGAESDERFDWTRFDVLYELKGKDVKKATGGIWMSGPSQQMQFSAFDQGSTMFDKGQVEYWNYDYAGVLHYTANVQCASVDHESGNARFMFQIPEGWPGLTGLYVVAAVHDGGTPGTNGDTYGHAATGDLSTAKTWCETGAGFSPALYTISSGNLVVHK